MFHTNKAIVYKIFLASCLVLCSGCKDRKEEEKEESVVKISIDVKKAREAHFSEWFSDVEIIPLETTENSLMYCLNNKLILRDGRYYIANHKQFAVFVFDSAGKFLYSTLLYKGEGPEDCLGVHDFAINPATGNLEVLIPFTQTVQVREAATGRFMKNIKIPVSLSDLSIFEPVSSDLYLFYAEPSDPTK